MTSLIGLSSKELERKAAQIRRDLVAVSLRNGAGHIAPSLSCVDILVALYYRIMNRNGDPSWQDRDRFVFSKAHGCYGLYVVLADIGSVERSDWEGFYAGSPLKGCCEMDINRGVEVGCGALGHGLPMAVGMAFGAKLRRVPWRVYVLVGDGEMQEGSNWEAIQFAVKHRLSNLTLIIDANGLQAMDSLENIMTVEGRKGDLQKKLRAFGMEVRTCNGHSARSIVKAIERWTKKEDLSSPQALVARTVKGYGLLCMENIPKFHFRLPTDEEMEMGNRYDGTCVEL